MGKQEPDECIFCETSLEEWDYEYFTENGERAGDGTWENDLDICKSCAWKLKNVLESAEEPKEDSE